MLNDDDQTGFAVTTTGRCNACRRLPEADEYMAAATTDISFVICARCTRGAVTAYARENKRRSAANKRA